MSAKIKVVLDTQIYLRALINRKSLPAKLVFDLRAKYQLVTSEAILGEINNVLNRPQLRKKFTTLTDNVVNPLLSSLRSEQMVQPPEPIP